MVVEDQGNPAAAPEDMADQTAFVEVGVDQVRLKVAEPAAGEAEQEPIEVKFMGVGSGGKLLIPGEIADAMDGEAGDVPAEMIRQDLDPVARACNAFASSKIRT